MTNNIEKTTNMQADATIPIFHDALEHNWQEMEIRERRKREKLTPTQAETYSRPNDPKHTNIPEKKILRHMQRTIRNGLVW